MAETSQQHDHSHTHAHGGDCCGSASKAKEEAGRVKDLVCGMTVDPHTAKHRAEHDRPRPTISAPPAAAPKFVADPATLSGAGAGRRRTGCARGTIYTCPMHPQIRAGGARHLPDLRHGARAGRSPRAGTGPNPELVDMTRRFWIALALAAAGLAPGDGRRISSALHTR